MERILIHTCRKSSE